MDNSSQQDNESDKQIVILKFMQVTQCQTYEEAKFFVAMHQYKLKDAIAAFMMSKGLGGRVTQSTDSSNVFNSRKNSMQQTKIPLNNEEFWLSPEQAIILQKRLRLGTFSSLESQNLNNLIKSQQKPQNKNLCQKFFGSCKNSFKCLDRIKKQLKKKINSMRKDSDKIFYFQQLYQVQLQEAGFFPQNGLMQGFELCQVQQNQKLKTLKNQGMKPIFTLICPNRKSPLISNFLNNIQLMTFIRQHFEPLFITLSQLKDLKLQRKHVIRNIKKCPTALAYMKNFYDLEDVLVRFEGEEIKGIDLQRLRMGLEQVSGLVKKWNYMLNLQKHLRENSVTSLSQVAHEDDFDTSYDHDSFNYTQTSHITPQHPQTKRSLIQQQTKIYQQLVAEEVQRKKSLQLEKQKLQQIKQLREIRKLSMPQQPSPDLLQQSIQFRFRCPLNGEYISRRFLKNQKVDILYQFVDTNEKIEFETQPQRNFDLFTSFPPMSLSLKKECLILQIFDQEKENILIREV